MNITFEVKNPNDIAVLFCRYIIRWLKREIVRDTNFESVQLRLDLLQLASWVHWVHKPQKIDAKQFVRLVINSLVYERRKNRYTITIDRHKLFPGTLTPLYKVVKFVDIGNDVIKGSYFLKHKEVKYQYNIYDYWAAFKIRLQR